MSNLDFEKLYGEALAQMTRDGSDAASLPSLAELKDFILQGQQCEQEPSPTFNAFFDWWNYFTAIEQMEEGYDAQDRKPILRVAYDALKASGHL
ncbi:hypothetical protein NPS53_09590 [Pseudomonas putida]|uniref:hypothetical protein n=1 Tax=Pseudomonas putida TaxID=303 RepID=UPI002363F6A5|nr:hypothetical protein [Pseudomonas putida]MDD2139830.1 hypothetical protein [Pseudomonas putida]HDS1721753.1 hypothetical protein [Pseudomonas putida]